jgi:hypothetical protein
MSAAPHTFHIPIMGTGFTIDTPIRVAHYGISSVISLVDDTLIEDTRRFYCEQTGTPYEAIPRYKEDSRARRITAYLNLVNEIVQKNFNALRASAFETGSEITKYFEMLPDNVSLKKMYTAMLAIKDPLVKKPLQEQLRSLMTPGRINVNIMTKLDRINYNTAGEQLPEEFSDALAALRGYANSTLESGIVLSAGLNRRLYTYIDKFADFFTDSLGHIKKQIILKVSDHRSAVTQGKFFAKKGLWVAEYRMESGLNCGGHAFAGNGYLMGPVLEEFKTKKNELITLLTTICHDALKGKNKTIPSCFPTPRITAQGGIGTFAENNFLMEHYNLDSTGWGTPFLLVPEVTNVDDDTFDRLLKASADDLTLSDVSPLGVPFHTLKDSSSERNKKKLIDEGRPGSACPLGHLVTTNEFATPQPICTASRQYQQLKLKQLESEDISTQEYEMKKSKIIAKACICNELGDGAYLKFNMKKQAAGLYPAVCPGPNIAYFDKMVSLKTMVDHIYGRTNIMTHPERPHMFIKELQLNIDFLSKLLRDNEKIDTLKEFNLNLQSGIAYYRELIPQISETLWEKKDESLQLIDACAKKLAGLPIPL